MQRENAGPVGSRRQHRLEPDLGGGPGVGEDERGLALLDRGDHLGQQPQADLPRPGEALHRLGDERVHLQRLGDQPLEDSARPRPAFAVHAEQRVARGIEIAERGGEAQRAEARTKTTETGETELGLHAPLRRHQLVPLVHDHKLEVVEQRGGIVAGEEEREAFGCGDQRRRQALALSRSDPRGRVAGAGLDGPGKPQILDRGAERGLGVAGECAQRSQPQHPERCRRAAAPRGGIVAEPLEHRSHPRGVGLARAGGRVDQSALPGEVGAPDLFLERERLPVVPRKPLANAVDRLAAFALHHPRRAPSRLRRPAGRLLRALLAPPGRARPPEVHRESGAAPGACRRQSPRPMARRYRRAE